jgi:opacity protein-like surface antigen
MTGRWRGWAVAALLAVGGGAAHGDAAPSGALDTGRFYLLVDAGHAVQLHDRFAADVTLDAPGPFHLTLGGAAGYNLTDRLGVELQAHGTEPTLVSPTLGTVKELSNITVVPALRARWHVLGERLVPWASVGVGWSYSDVNDQGNDRVKVEMDEQGVVTGVGAGVEYFVADDVALGLGARAWIYPEADATLVVRDDANRIVRREDETIDLTAVAVLAQIRLFPGQSARGPDGQPRRRRLLVADRGPFDTGARRVYLYALGGHHVVLDDRVGGGVRLEAPGNFNATLGGGVGVNLDRWWGVELQLAQSEPNVRSGAEGKFAEVGILTVLPGVRYRRPIWGDRFVPFAIAGLGAAFTDVNDRRDRTDRSFDRTIAPAPRVRVDQASIAAGVAVGAEYWLNAHLTIGASLPFYFYPDWDTFVQRRAADGRLLAPHRQTTNYSGLVPMVRVAAYLP